MRRRFVPFSETLPGRISPSGAGAVAPAQVAASPATSGLGNEPDPSDFYPNPIGPEPADFDGDDVPFVLIPPVQIGPAGPAF